MKRVLYLATMGILAVLLWVNYAAAQVVTFTYTGQVTFVLGTPMGVQVSAGDPVVGTMSWDPSQAPLFESATFAYYLLVPPSGTTATLGGSTLTTVGESTVGVVNDPSQDAVSIFVAGGSVAKDGQPATGSISLYMADLTSTAFNSTALPSDLNAAAFSFTTGGIFDTNGATIFFTIDSIVIAEREVLIDARYYNPNDIVSIKSNGYLRVAIMTTDASSEFGAFDATTVDPSTVTFAEATPADFKYVVRDGAYDLLLQFRVSDLTLQCGTMPVTLEAKTWDGLSLYGEDTLNIVGCQ